MKKVIAAALVIMLTLSSINAQEVPAAIKSIAPKLSKIAASPSLVAAVKAQNAKNVSLDKIKELDSKWSETSGLDDFMKQVLASTASEYLKKVRKENSFIVEAFAMDNKGANVGMTNKTSDYWQGDEDKFTKSYNGGAGGTHFSKLSFDESTQSYVIQVSVAVMESGKAIGAVTFGIDPAKIK